MSPALGPAVTVEYPSSSSPLRRRNDLRTCRGCGCTDLRACPGGCAWVLLDVDEPSGICSTCAEAFEWDPLLMANEGWYRDEAGEEPYRPLVLLP